jgi:hypothetical protein
MMVVLQLQYGLNVHAGLSMVLISLGFEMLVVGVLVIPVFQNPGKYITNLV